MRWEINILSLPYNELDKNEENVDFLSLLLDYSLRPSVFNKCLLNWTLDDKFEF